MPLNELAQWDIYTESGDEVGEIKKLVVDPQTGLVAFALVDKGLLNGDLKAVPLTDLKPNEYSETLVMADAAYSGALPSDYRATKHGRYSYEDAKQVYTENEMRDNVGVMRNMQREKMNNTAISPGADLIEAQILEGASVVFQNGAPIGVLDTMLVDIKSKMIKVALVRLTDADLDTEEMKAVPWKALDMEPSTYHFSIAVTHKKMFEQSPKFKKNEADFSVDAARNLYKQYGFIHYQDSVE